MTTLPLVSFGGISRVQAPALSRLGEAEEAENITLHGGVVRPIQGSSTPPVDLVGTDWSADIKRMFPFLKESGDFYWLFWENLVDVVDGPIVEDAFGRIYWTDGTQPKVLALRSGGSFSAPTSRIVDDLGRDLGLNAPQSTPTMNAQGAINLDDPLLEVTYVCTFVSDYGEESPPSPVATHSGSKTLTINDGQTVVVSIAYVAGDAQTGISKVRLYRANVGTQTANFQYVSEQATNGSGSSTFNDSTRAFLLGEVLPSDTWDPPPAKLEGLTSLPGGVLAGFITRSLYFSEPYLPHAWPPQYRVAVDNDIVALGVTAEGLVVLTEGAPYLVSGSDPSNYVVSRVEFPQGCTNSEAVVDMGGYLIYPSPDGLAQISGIGASLLTRDMVRPEEWKEANSLTSPGFDSGKGYSAAFWEGRYLGFKTSASGSIVRAPVLDPTQQGQLTVSGSGLGPYVAAYSTERDGKLYVPTNNNGTLAVVSFGNGANLTGKWFSRTFRLAERTSFSHLYLSTEEQIDAEGDLVEVILRYQDLVKYHKVQVSHSTLGVKEQRSGSDWEEFSRATLTRNASEALTSSSPWVFILPPFPTSLVRVELQTNVGVNALVLADNLQELTSIQTRVGS